MKLDWVHTLARYSLYIYPFSFCLLYDVSYLLK